MRHNLRARFLRDTTAATGGGGGGGAAAPAVATPATTEPPATPPAQPAPANQPPAAAESVESLPDWAQKLIADAREDAAKARTSAKDQAAQEARDALAQDIGKALGLIKDGEPADPAKLQQAITEREATIAEQARELAVYKATPTGVDPNKLLDSRSFLASIKDIDPADSQALAAAVETHIRDNPGVRTNPGRASGVSGADFAGGPSGPTDLQTRIAEAEKNRDFRTAIALKQQLAATKTAG